MFLLCTMSQSKYKDGTAIYRHSVYYVKNTNKNIDINSISEEIYKFTKGYPYLVSLICKTIDESDKYEWRMLGINMAIKNILLVTNTLFDDLSKNISNNKDLYKFFREILLEDKKVLFNLNIPVINLASMFGYIKADEDGYVTISNIIFSEVILNYMVEKIDTAEIDLLNEKSKYISLDGRLSMDKVIHEFQRFMKRSYERGNHKFLEDNGRLLFSAFITPSINGTGYFYREARTGDMRRMDLVVQYGNDRFIIELKRDIGYSTKKTLQQVQDYMLLENTNVGYIITFTYGKKSDFIEHKREEKIINREGKRSFHLLTEINRIKRMSSFWLGFTYDRVVPIPPSCVLQFFIISQTHPKNILFNHNQNWGVGNTKRRRKKTQSR